MTFKTILVSCFAFASIAAYSQASVKWSAPIKLTGKNSSYYPSPVEYLGQNNDYLFILLGKDAENGEYVIQKLEKSSLRVVKEMPCSSNEYIFRDNTIGLFSAYPSANQKNIEYTYTGYDLDLNLVSTKEKFLSVPLDECGHVKEIGHGSINFTYNDANKYILVERMCMHYFLDTTLTLIKQVSNIRQKSEQYFTSRTIISPDKEVVSILPEGKGGSPLKLQLEINGKVTGTLQVALPEKTHSEDFRIETSDNGKNVVVFGLYGTKENCSDGFYINKFELATGTPVSQKLIPYTEDLKRYFSSEKCGLSSYKLSSFRINDDGSLALTLEHLSESRMPMTTTYGVNMPSDNFYISGPLYCIRITAEGQIMNSIIKDYPKQSNMQYLLSPLISYFDNTCYYTFTDRESEHIENGNDKKNVIGIYTVDIKGLVVKKTYLPMPISSSQEIMSGRGKMPDANHIFIIAQSNYKNLQYGYITLE